MKNTIGADTTVLIQGSVLDEESNISGDFCKYIRKTMASMPQCKFVLSTWEVDENKKSILKDLLGPDAKVIYNEDPGALSKDIHKHTITTNVNRMIVSTLNGLRNVSTKYVVKMRTDSYIFSDNILGKLGGIGSYARLPSYSLFDSYIVNCNLFARHHESYLPFLFHPGDIMMAGLTKDLITLFDVPLAEKSLIELCYYRYSTCNMTLVPEQFIWLSCLKRNGHNNIRFSSNFEINSFAAKQSENYYMTNFIPYTDKELGFCWPKYINQYKNKGRHTLYIFDDWLYFYSTVVLRLKKKKSTYQKLMRPTIFFIMKIIYYFRTFLLKNKFIRSYSYNKFVKRGR